MTERHLVIWWDGVVVGTLSQDRHGDLGFVYADDWLTSRQARPLWRSLPLRTEASKLPVVLIDGKPALPAPGHPTTHIIKP